MTQGLSSLKLIRLVERVIFRSRMATFLLLVLAILVVKAGVSTNDVGLGASIARNPFIYPSTLTADNDFLLTTWLNPFLAWLLGLNTPRGIVALSQLYAMAFVALFLNHVTRALPPREARVAILLLVFLPLPGDLLRVGTPDSLTALLCIGILVSRRFWLAVGIAILLGLQHFEQGAVAFGALLFATMLDRSLGRRRDAAMLTAALGLAGVVLGKIGLIILFKYYHMSPTADRAVWAEHNLPSLVEHFVLNPQYIIYSVLGVGWLVAAKFAEAGRHSIPFLIGLIGLMALLPITLDETRVLAIVTFPLIFVYWLSNEGFLASLRNQFISELTLLWLIVPWVWVFQGEPIPSAFSLDALEFFRLIRHLVAPS